MQIAVCDDVQIDRKMLRSTIEALRPTAQVLEYDSAEALLTAHREGVRFDLIFLDIFLEGMNGMDAARSLRQHDIQTALVFLSCTRDFAVESYGVSALSYLVKPLDKKALEQVLDRFEATWRPRNIFIRDRFFTTDDIVYVESRDKRVTFTFKDGATAEITTKLGEVEDQLKGRNFLRCHRSFIINMDHVARIGDKCFITTNEDIVLIRQKQYAAMKKHYYDYITSQ